ncbi:MAG: hypothetical protein K2R98_12670 [Gemmataceae bacterium]|nr:hypothetical protein [Gemmataceae bacterium]
MWHTLILCSMLVSPAIGGSSEVATYEGTWLTTNRKLDGTMTCVVTDLGENQWRGKFSGVWEGASFSYTVRFSGPPQKLHGTAVIDGASYEWTGAMEKDRFWGTFGGNRYAGSFDLKLKSK